MKTLSAVVVVVLLSFSSCFSEGQSCTGGAVCTGKDTSLWCDSATLVAYRCPGELGCTTTDNGGVLCDFRGSAEGQPCPLLAKDVGYCATSTRFIQCKAGKWVGTECTSCTTSGTASACRQ